VENGKAQAAKHLGEQIADPEAEEAVLLRSGKSFRGAAAPRVKVRVSQ